jgi:hypothetical protein
MVQRVAGGVTAVFSPPLDAVPATRTGTVAPARTELIPPWVPPAPLIPATPSDPALRPRPPVDAPVEILGLGPLPADGPGLEARVTRLVRTQGLREVTRLLADARRSATLLANTLTRHGRSAEHAEESLRRVRVMEARLPALAAEREAVQSNLQPFIVEEAHLALDAALAGVAERERQYFERSGAPRAEALRSLRSDAQALLSASMEARRGGPEAEARFAAVHREVSRRHPILASFDLATPEVSKLQDLARAVTNDEYDPQPRRVDEPLRGMLMAVRSAAVELRSALRDDPTVVWRLPGVVDATLIRHGVPADGMVAAHARDVLREQAGDDGRLRAFVSVVSVGLGIAAALPSGGASLTVAAALTTAVDGLQLYMSVEDYRFAAAASGTALDRREALSDEVPSAGWLAVDALCAASGAAGAAVALRKAAFTRLLADQGPVGAMARGLELRLGAERAASLVDRFGEAQADHLFRDLAPETWHALAELPAGRFDAALGALQPDGLRTLERTLGPGPAAAWIAELPEAGWRGLGATLLEPEALARVAQRFSPPEVAHLAPVLTGRGLAELAEHVGDATLSVAKDHVLVDAQLRLHPHQLLRRAQAGALPELRRDLATARALSPTVQALGPLNPSQLTDLKRLADDLKAGEPLDAATLKRLTTHDRRPDTVKRAVRELADQVIHLSPRAEALAQAAPELRSGLEALQTSGVGPALSRRALDLMERALAHRGVTFDRAHLGT